MGVEPTLSFKSFLGKKKELFFFLLWWKEAAESFRCRSTRRRCLVFAEGRTDDSIVQPRPEEEEKLSANT